MTDTLDGLAWWRQNDPQRQDPNWGRTCLMCDAAVPAGMRYHHAERCGGIDVPKTCPSCGSIFHGSPCPLAGYTGPTFSSARARARMVAAHNKVLWEGSDD